MTLPVALELGTRPLPDLVASLRHAGVRFNAYGEALLASGDVTVAPAPRRVHVVVRTVGELGWPAGALMDEVLAQERPCPLEVALLLRLAWRSEAVWPRVTVASARAHPEEARPRGFYLRDDAEGCWLRAYVASDDWVFPPEERLALLSA